MKKRIFSTLALGIACSNIVPIIANAMPVDGEISNTEENVENTQKAEEKVVVRADFYNIQSKYPKLKMIKQNELNLVNFSEKFAEQLDKSINDLNKAINNKNLDELKVVINEFFRIHKEMNTYEDVKLHAENDQFDYAMFNSIALIFELTEGDEALRNKTLSDFVDGMYVSSAKKFNETKGLVFMKRYTQYIHRALSPYLKDEKTKETISIAFSKINAIELFVPSLNPNEDYNPTFPEEEVPSITKPEEVIPEDDELLEDEKEEIPPIKPPIKPPVAPPTGGGDYVDNNKGYENSEYVNKKGVCYKVTKIYDVNHKLLKVVEEKVDKSMNGGRLLVAE